MNSTKKYKGHRVSPKYPEIAKYIIDNPTNKYADYILKFGKRKAKTPAIFNGVKNALSKSGLQTATGEKAFKVKLINLVAKTTSLKGLTTPKEIFNFINKEILEPINKNQKGYTVECVPEGFSDDVCLRVELHTK